MKVYNFSKTNIKKKNFNILKTYLNIYNLTKKCFVKWTFPKI